MADSWSGSPKTWVTDDDLDATTLLAEIRDRFDFLKARSTDYVCVRDEKSSGTDGGTFTSGDWRTRTLNTLKTDVNGIASLATNQVTLPDGDYIFEGMACLHVVGKNQLRLYNATDTAAIWEGLNDRNPDAANGQHAVIKGYFSIASSKAIELQHRCETTRATDGFGVNAAWGTEVYAQVEFWRIDK